MEIINFFFGSTRPFSHSSNVVKSDAGFDGGSYSLAFCCVFGFPPPPFSIPPLGHSLLQCLRQLPYLIFRPHEMVSDRSRLYVRSVIRSPTQ